MPAGRCRRAGSPSRSGGGTYQRSQPFELTEKDSGAENAPAVYRARHGESVRLVGGRVVTDWKQVTDAAVLARLDESARGKVWQADLRAQGITAFGDVAASGRRLEFFFQDKPMTVARWPNEGFIEITEVLGPTPVDVRGTKGCKEGKSFFITSAASQDAAAWASISTISSAAPKSPATSSTR